MQFLHYRVNSNHSLHAEVKMELTTPQIDTDNGSQAIALVAMVVLVIGNSLA